MEESIRQQNHSQFTQTGATELKSMVNGDVLDLSW